MKFYALITFEGKSRAELSNCVKHSTGAIVLSQAFSDRSFNYVLLTKKVNILKIISKTAEESQADFKYKNCLKCRSKSKFFILTIELIYYKSC